MIELISSDFWRWIASFHCFILFAYTSCAVASNPAIQSCYVCNSAINPECASTTKIKQAISLRKPCNTYRDFESLMNRTHARGSKSTTDFITQPSWVGGSDDSYITVCMKIVDKLSSRDPPGTKNDPDKNKNDVRNAMPLRHVRYCGIELKKSHERKSPQCESKIASAKMDITICHCYTDLCNLAHHNLELSLLFIFCDLFLINLSTF